MSSPIIEMDVHGLTAQEAVNKIAKIVSSAEKSVYRIRIIHGYNRGTNIKDAVSREFGYGLEPKVLRIEGGQNEGITELILREYFK